MTGALEPHRRMLWAVAWRMLGDPEEAGDVVQETFLRALDRPPGRHAAPLGRLAFARGDEPRARPPAPAPPPRLGGPLAPRRRWRWSAWPIRRVDPERQAVLRETAAYAWLVAAESLTPTQRAVLLLREVAGLDVAETADALGLTAGNVKVHHHRARRALGTVGPATGGPRGGCGRPAALPAGGEHGGTARPRAPASRPTCACCRTVAGATTPRGCRWSAPTRWPACTCSSRSGGAPDRLRLVQVPGGGGLVAEHGPPPPPGQAPRWVQLARLGPDGKIAALWSGVGRRRR
jgi:DNA-directed RNA polymerase specialized sigma24 family protein